MLEFPCAHVGSTCVALHMFKQNNFLVGINVLSVGTMFLQTANGAAVQEQVDYLTSICEYLEIIWLFRY